MKSAQAPPIPEPCLGLSFLVCISSVVLCKTWPDWYIIRHFWREIDTCTSFRKQGKDEGRTWRNKELRTLGLASGNAKISFGSSLWRCGKELTSNPLFMWVSQSSFSSYVIHWTHTLDPNCSSSSFVIFSSSKLKQLRRPSEHQICSFINTHPFVSPFTTWLFSMADNGRWARV